MKRETGARPVRTRHCKRGVTAARPLGDREGSGSVDPQARRPACRIHEMFRARLMRAGAVSDTVFCRAIDVHFSIILCGKICAEPRRGR